MTVAAALLARELDLTVPAATERVERAARCAGGPVSRLADGVIALLADVGHPEG